jgi:hypothetical protein
MYASVRVAFAAFTAQFEAPRDFMYLDVKGLVTIGYGNLIDPVALAQALPFVQKSNPNNPATPAEVEAEWSAVKLRSDLRLRGSAAYASITSLRVSEAALNRLTAERLTSFEQTLKRTFGSFETWPADAQLGLLSMAWVLGPAFSGGWPQFTRACVDRRWDDASMQCHMDDTGTPELAPRNLADAVLFANAAQIEAGGMPLDQICFPRNLAAENLGAIAIV